LTCFQTKSTELSGITQKKKKERTGKEDGASHLSKHQGENRPRKIKEGAEGLLGNLEKIGPKVTGGRKKN